MKRRFTILTAALALLAFLAIPMGMRGQSDYSTDYTGNITLSITGGTSATACKVVINTIEYDGIKAGTSSTAGAMKITVPADTKYLHMHVAAWNNTTCSLAVTPAGYSDNIALTANSGISNNSPFTFNGDPSTTDYYKVITFDNALDADTELTFTAVGGKRFVIWGVTSEEEGGTSIVAKPTITPNGGSFLDSQEVSISCATDGATIYYTTNGNDPTTLSTQYTAPFTLTATTTVKAFAVKTGYDNSNIATAVFTKTTPMTVAEARDFIDDLNGGTSDDVYVSGIISQIDQYNSNYHSITYWISDDGTTADQLEVYSGKGLNGTDFNSLSDLVLQSEVIVKGKLKKYGDIYEFTQSSQIVSLTLPAVIVETPTFNPAGGTYTEAQTVTIRCATAGATIYYTTDGTEPDDESTRYTAPITVSETTTIKAIAYNSEDQSSAVATATYTINLPAPELTFSKTDGHNPVEGQTYLIVDLNSNRALTSAKGSGSAPTADEVTITNDQITTDNTALQWTFEATDGGYIIHPISDDTKWLYTTDANNGVRVGTNENKVWTLDVTDETNSDYHGFMNNATSRYLGVYNNQDWRTYTTIHANIKDTQIALFVLGDAPAPSPSITIENNNEIAYDATSGSFNYIVNNPVDGGQIAVSENEDWIGNAQTSVTPNGNMVTFTTTVNESGTARHGVITLTYTYNRTTITKNVTVTQAGNPSIIMTIAEVRAQGTGDVVTIGTVTSFSVNNSSKTTAYIQDATAAIVVFGEFTVAVGDEIRASGTLNNYYGLLEIGSNNSSATIEVLSQNNTVNPQLMTIAEINASTNQGWYIRVEEATVSAINGQNTTIAQGENTIVVRGISGVEYAVNDILSLNGNIGYYNGSQIANPQNVEVEQNTTPSITIEPATITLDADETDDIIVVIYHNITNIVAEVQFFAVDGETSATYDWITAEIDNDNNVYYMIDANEGEARTAYLKVKVGDIYSNLVTITQAAPVVDYATLPFEYDGNGLGTLPNGLTQNGLTGKYDASPKMKFDNTDDWLILHFEEAPGRLSFDIKGNPSSGNWSGTFTVQTSEDGTNYTDLATYTELTNTVQSERFNNLGEDVRYIKWVFTEKVSGNVALGNIKLSLPSSGEYSLTVAPFENLEIFTFVGDELTEPMEGAGTIQVAEGDQVMLSVSADDGYVMQSLIVDGVEHVNDIDDDLTYTFTMPGHNVTISATAVEEVPPVPGEWVLTDLADLTEGDVFVIVGTFGTDSYAMANDNGTSSAPAAVAVTVVDNTLSGEIAENIQWNISGNATDGYTFYPNGDAENWLYCTSTNNGVRVGTNDNNAFTFVSGGEGQADYLYNTATERYIGIYLGNPDWRCYTTININITGQSFAFYKNVAETVTYTKNITGYGTSEGGYCLVASPVAMVVPSADNGFLTSAYDLYAYDQNGDSEGNEWLNYKANAFNLRAGKGYLYASSANTTLTFTGAPYNGNGQIELAYNAAANAPGWNLVGNPFAETAYINRPFYIMKTDGTEIILSQRSNVNFMEAIFVVATGAGETVTFSTTAPAKGNSLVLNVSQDDGTVIDRAMVGFNEGNMLPKFQLHENSTKLSIADGGNEYAMVSSTGRGEMPVNFKAAENGTYTLSVDAEGMEMQCLHLIDNLTGKDIDLLQTPSYSFEATVSDNAARFTLVFVAR